MDTYTYSYDDLMRHNLIVERNKSINDDVKTIIMPSYVKFIKPDTFKNYKNLEKIIFVDQDGKEVLTNDLIEIGESAFENSGIKEFIFTTKLNRIRPNAFKNSDIKKLICVDGWPKYNAMSGSFESTNIDEMHLTHSLISSSAFNNCCIKTLHLESTCRANNIINQCNVENLKLYGDEELLPFFTFGTSISDITFIGDFKKLNYNSLSSLKNLKVLELPNGIKEIKSAIRDNANLNTIYIPNSVIKFDIGNFESCPKLKNINVSSSINIDLFIQIVESLSNSQKQNNDYHVVNIRLFGDIKKSKLKRLKKYSTDSINVILSEEKEEIKEDNSRQGIIDKLIEEVKSALDVIPDNQRKEYIIRYNSIIDEYNTGVSAYEGINLTFENFESLIMKMSNLKNDIVTSQQSFQLMKDLKKYRECITKSNYIKKPITIEDMIYNIVYISSQVSSEYLECVKKEINNNIDKTEINTRKQNKIVLELDSIDDIELYKRIHNLLEEVELKYNNNRELINLVNTLKSNEVKKDTDIFNISDNILSMNYVVSFINKKEYTDSYLKLKNHYIKIITDIINRQDNIKPNINIVIPHLASDLINFISSISGCCNIESIRNNTINKLALTGNEVLKKPSEVKLFVDDIFELLSDQEIDYRLKELLKLTKYISDSEKNIKESATVEEIKKLYFELLKTLAGMEIDINTYKNNEKNKVMIKKIEV